LSGTGRDRLKAAAMRHEDVIRCGLCGRKLAIIEQNEAQAVQRANRMTLEISP
jgi:hypothetical protein